MNWYDYLLIYISSCSLVYFVIKSCSNLLNIKRKTNIIFILVILISGLLITYSLYSNNTFGNILFSLIVFSMGNIILYKQNLYKNIFNTMLVYLIMLVFEILLSIIIINVFKFNLESFNTNSFMKALFSTVDGLLAYLVCSIKQVKYVINKIQNKSIVVNSFLPVSIICLIILDAKYIFLESDVIFIENIIIISVLLYILFYAIITDQKLTQENEKIEILLNYMSKYEKIIDDNRAYKHELLNNLLVLKSYKNKNSNEFNDFLDELIDSNSNKNVSIKNIYNLPSGLKGIFYYKLFNLDEKEYNISINISKKLGTTLNKISHKDYINLYKIIGIVLDNAIEACSMTKNKYLMIDVYKEDNSIIIDISNSFNNKINLVNMHKKGYTTKGDKRGLGLYIARNIIKNSEKLKMIQDVNQNIFITKIKVSL